MLHKKNYRQVRQQFQTEKRIENKKTKMKKKKIQKKKRICISLETKDIWCFKGKKENSFEKLNASDEKANNVV